MMRRQHRLRHEQVIINGVEVDRGIAPLIVELWRLGYRTQFSCEDNVPKGYAWISFTTRIDGVRFLRFLFNILTYDLQRNDDIRIQFVPIIPEEGINEMSEEVLDGLCKSTDSACSVRFPSRLIEFVSQSLKRIKC